MERLTKEQFVERYKQDKIRKAKEKDNIFMDYVCTRQAKWFRRQIQKGNYI